jgi:hypothetical protein
LLNAGLGKTVEVLALVLANPAPAAIVNGSQVTTKNGSFVQSRGTLVICKARLPRLHCVTSCQFV